MLKRLVLGSTALVALASTALAADLPSRRAPAPYVAVPVFTWTGFYIGINAGYGFSTQRNALTNGISPITVANVANGFRPASVNLDQEGFTGGGQIGYNYQFGGFVIGLEADAAYTDLTRRRAVVTPAPGGLNVLRHDVDYIGTVRGRVGYAFDRVLVYGTGGFAYGDVSTGATFFSPAGVPQFVGNRSRMETGYAAGGGVEYAIPTDFSLFGSSAVTLKAEALYYDLGRQSVLIAAVPGVAGAAAFPGYRTSFETSGVLARAGINFKFGSY